MAHSQLVHMVQWLPVLSIHVEEVHLSISVGVLSTDQEDLVVRNCDGAASPKWVLHSNGEDLPQVLLHLVELNAVINLLLCASKEPSEGVNALVSDRACAQVVPLVFHGCNLRPFVLSDVVLFH